MSEKWIGLWPQNPNNLENTEFYPFLNLIKDYLNLEELVILMQTSKFFYWFILKNQLILNVVDKRKCNHCYQKIGSCVCYNKIRCCHNDVGDQEITLSLIKSHHQIDFTNKARNYVCGDLEWEWRVCLL